MNSNIKQKALVFYTYLPPWRIDIFNEMGKLYDLTIIFTNADSYGFTYDRTLLLSQLKVDTIFLNKGFTLGNKTFRYGVLNIIKKYKPEVIFAHEYSPISILLATYKMLRLFNFDLVITTSDNLKMAQSVSFAKKHFVNMYYPKVKELLYIVNL